jgi:hypothetical protein
VDTGFRFELRGGGGVILLHPTRPRSLYPFGFRTNKNAGGGREEEEEEDEEVRKRKKWGNSGKMRRKRGRRRKRKRGSRGVKVVEVGLGRGGDWGRWEVALG